MHKLSQELYGSFFSKFNPVHQKIGKMDDFREFYNFVYAKVDGTKFEGIVLDIMFSDFPSKPTVYGQFEITDSDRWVNGYNKINEIFNLMEKT